MVPSTVTASVISALLSGAISFFVSKRVAKEQAREQMRLEHQQRLREWYERCIALAQRTNDDWWEVMASGESDYDVDSEEIFLARRDELREHAARGQGLGADEEVVQNLKQASGHLNYATSKLDSGRKLADIEGDLLPLLDLTEEMCEEKSDVSHRK